MFRVYTWQRIRRHQMPTFTPLLSLCAGNSPVVGEFPAQSPVTRSFDVSLIFAWTNSLANNGDAGDLRCHCAQYDVTVMSQSKILSWYYAHWPGYRPSQWSHSNYSNRVISGYGKTNKVYYCNVVHIYDTVLALLEIQITGLILGLHPANERRRYKVTPSLIGWAQS